MHGFVLCLHCFWIFLFVSLPFSGVWRDSIWAVLFRSCDFPYKLVTSLMDRLLHHMKMLGCKYLLTIDPWFLRKKGIKKAVNYYKREKTWLVNSSIYSLPEMFSSDVGRWQLKKSEYALSFPRKVQVVCILEKYHSVLKLIIDHRRVFINSIKQW
jgi:hypothetical protein